MLAPSTLDWSWISFPTRLLRCDYTCGIKVDEDFETVVYELRTYFGIFKFAHTCETILRFYSYDGSTNHVKFNTGGLQGVKAFCLVTLHLWVRILKKFPDLPRSDLR